jgi:excisionase family DNA binding protein
MSLSGKSLMIGKQRNDVRPQFDSGERFLGVGTVATYFDVTDVTIKNWVNTGKLQAARTPGGHRRVAVSSVVALLEEQGRTIPSELSSRPVVLVLEREEGVGRMLKRHLAGRAQVVVVRDDYSALFAIGRTRPAVIVLDLDVPKLDGKRLVLALRNEAEIGDVDIVALAGPASAKLARSWSDEGKGSGLLYVYRRAEKDAILASVAAILDRAKQTRRSA